MNEKYAKPSAILSVVCALTLYLSYEMAPDQPEGLIVFILQFLFFSSILTGILSIIFTFLAYRNNEKGFLKNIAPMIILSIAFVFALSSVFIVAGLS